MSALLTTAEGRRTVIEAQKFLLRRRLSRFFKRNLVIDYDGWSRGAHEFDLGHLLGSLNSAHDDELRDLYRLLGTVGGLDETIANLHYWVDPTNGDDINGTGSLDRPYASLWFLNMLPHRISHPVRIFLLSDLTMTGNVVIDNTFVGTTGFLSIIGVGAPEIGGSGVLTSLAVTTLDGVSGVAVQATAPIVEDDNSGWWLQTLDGAKPNYAVPLHDKYAADTVICRRMPLSMMAPGDTFRFIRPARNVEITGSLTIQARGGHLMSTFTGRGSRVVFTNINLDVTSGGFGVYNKIVIDSKAKTNMTFVNLTSGAPEIHIKSELNSASAIDDQLAAYSQCTVANLDHEVSGIIHRMAGLLVGDFKDVSIQAWCWDGAIVYSTDFHNGVQVNGTASIYHSAGVAYFMNNQHGELFSVLADGFDGAGQSGAGLTFENSNVYIDNIDVLDSDCVLVVDSSSIRAGLVRADAVFSAITGYGINFLGTGQVLFVDSPVGCTGALNDLLFRTVNPAAAAAHPAFWLSATDGQQSIVKRLGV
jgi:hypothetical protein